MSEIRWQIYSKRPLEFARWAHEELVVVYQPLSGDLHLLNDLAARLLRQLQRRPQSESELQASLYSDKHSGGVLHRTLLQFQGLGLIEPETS